jgi:hypothetical protein
MNPTDNQRLIKATRNGNDIPVYDDGYGPLWIHRDSMGITAVVRAKTWEDAYSICEDEFFPEADETIEELVAEYTTLYMSCRELWDYENPERPFHTLKEHERLGVLQARRGRDVPFTADFTEHPCFQEAYGFRPNGPNVRDKIGHGIYAKDLNGDALDRLTDALIAELELTLTITDYWEVEADSRNHLAYGRVFWPYAGESEAEARAEFEKRKAGGYTVNLTRNGETVETFTPEETCHE